MLEKKMDKATKDAYLGWSVFTKATTYAVIGGSLLLVLLAIVIV